MRMTKNKRLVTISVVQFFASVCILARHYSYFLKPDFPIIASAVGHVTFTDYFFCCSGFFMHYVYSGKQSVELGPLLKKRFAKLYPLHLATTLFYVVILLASAHMGSLGTTRSGWDCLLPTVFLTHAFGTVDRQCLNYPSWFLSALFALYVAYPAIRLLMRKTGAFSVVAIVAVVLIVCEAGYRFDGWLHWSALTYNFGIVRGIPTFLAGVLIAEFLPAIESRVTNFWPAYAVFVLAVASMMAGLDPLFCYGVLPVALVALLAGAEAHGANSFLRSPKIVQVGAWSFPLYLVHVPIAAVVLNFLFVRYLRLEGVALLVAAVATAAIAIATSYVLHKVLDDWGPRWWMARRALET